MPATPIYGWPFEQYPSDQPGITLHGGSSGTEPILAEAIEPDLARVEGDISDLQDDVAVGWRPIASGTETGNFTIDLTAGGTYPAGTFDLIQVFFRGATSVDGVRVNARVNSDTTASMHLRTWQVKNFDSDAIIDSLAGETPDVTSWPFAYWSSGVSCNASMTIYNTGSSAILSMESNSYRASSGSTIRHVGTFRGHLALARLLDSLQIFPFSGTITACRWWAMGLRSV